MKPNTSHSNPAGFVMKFQFNPRISRRWPAAALLIALGGFALLPQSEAADQYWRVDGTSATWTSSNWSTTGSAPYSTGWTANNNAIFNANSLITYVTNTAVGNITVADGVKVTLTAAGTYSTGGAVRTLSVGTGSILDFAAQGFSTTAGTGFIKSGAGILFTSNGNSYTGGFTLNDGIVIVGGVNALGNGGALTINGGTIAANNTRNITARYSSVTIGGNFTLGAVTTGVTSGNGSATANITFADNMGLGAATRTITIGSNGTYTLSGVLSGSAGTGLTVNAASGATGSLVLSGANTYTGTTTVLAGKLTYGASNVISTGAVTVNGSTAVLDMGANRTDSVGTVTLDGGSITGTGTSTLTSTGTFEMKSGSVTAALAGSGIALNKSTGGTVTLSGTNTYTGATTVSAGTLLVNGSLANTTTSVSSTATLGGTGTIGGAVSVATGGFIAPGASIESLGLASLDLAGTLLVEWDTTVSPSIDLLDVTGALNLGGTSAVSFSNLGSGSLDLNTAYVFAKYAPGSLTGTFSSVSNLPVGFTLDYNYGGLSQIAIVPEPSTILLTFAFAGIPLLRRSRRRSA